MNSLCMLKTNPFDCSQILYWKNTKTDFAIHISKHFIRFIVFRQNTDLKTALDIHIVELFLHIFPIEIDKP